MADGVDYRRIDQLMERFGWPMGPAWLLDVVGLDTARHASGVMAQGYPDRMGHAGPTAIAVQMAHGIPPLQTLQLAWLVRNSACSEFLFSCDRFSLLGFNEVPHLADPGLVTYR